MDHGAFLQDFERNLDPADPADGPFEVQVVGFGEVAAVLTVRGLPGVVCKRMAGFPDAGAVGDYASVVERYIRVLGERGVSVVDTSVYTVESRDHGYTAYLIQPEIPSTELGTHVLLEGSDDELTAVLDAVLRVAGRLLLANQRPKDGRTVTVDAQLSNWRWLRNSEGTAELALFDVGTPFMRLDGVDELGSDVFLYPVPQPARAYYRRKRAVERYIDDYFDIHKLFVDILGNFYKEGRPERIALAIGLYDRWRRGEGAALEPPPVTEQQVASYYRKDASDLERYLKVRRFHRFLRTKVLRRHYSFILPGKIRR
ncbi:MAG: DUF6206 family protein [Candidatus Binatia bacterium]